MLNRVHAYADADSIAMVNRQTGEAVTDFSKPNPDVVLEQKQFQIASYEWGVTYAGMMLAAENTGDARFKDYVAKRFQIFADVVPGLRAQAATQPAAGRGGAAGGRGGRARALPSAGCSTPTPSTPPARCALIKARRASIGPDLMGQINVYMDWIANKQMQLQRRDAREKPPAP